MNPSPEFLGIQLENSILCKHRKIAGRVETIFCEAAPIRLNEICRLKRLGPEPTAFDRCPECRQYVCNCLWKKHIHVRSNEKLFTGNCNAAGISKVKNRPKINLMPFKIRKRNSNYGNTYSTQMAWLKKPVHKMSFSDDELDLDKKEPKRDHHRTQQSNAVKLKNENIIQNFNCMLQTPGKIDSNDYIQLRQEYFDNCRKPMAEEKSVAGSVKTIKKTKTIATPKMSRQNRLLESQPANKCMKDNIKEYSTPKQVTSMHLNMMVPPAAAPIPPRSPEYVPTKAEATYDERRMPNYANRVTDILHSRSMFGHQKQCTCQHPAVVNNARMNHLKKMTEAFNYPSRFTPTKTECKDCRRKASEFLFKYNEKNVSKPARTIESLENMEQYAKKLSNKSGAYKSLAVKNNAFYGNSKMFQPKEHKRISYRSTSGSNTTTSRSNYDRGEQLIMKHIAVQTEESSFSIPKLIKAQTSDHYDLMRPDGDKDRHKAISFRATAVESSLRQIEKDFGEALVQELVCELTDEVAKCNSRVKKLAALFESRSKINRSTLNRSQSLGKLNIQSKEDVNLNRESIKSFCSAEEFSKSLKNQTQEHFNDEVFRKNNSSIDDDFDQIGDYDSSSSSRSCSEVSITTVVYNPFKKDKEIIKPNK